MNKSEDLREENGELKGSGLLAETSAIIERTEAAGTNETIAAGTNETITAGTYETINDWSGNDSPEKDLSDPLRSERTAAASAPGSSLPCSSATRVTMAVLVAGLIGGIAGFAFGCLEKPIPRTEDLVVTEDVTEQMSQTDTSAGAASAAVPARPYTQITDIMDNARHVVEERFYAADGSLVDCGDGYAIVRRAYDENGNLTGTAYFDALDQPAFVRHLGYSSVAMTYDDSNNKTGETYYDESGNEVHIE